MNITINNNLIIPENILNFTPSNKDNINKYIESIHRRFICDLIQESGILLKLYLFN